MAENKLADLSTNFAVKILKLTDGKKKDVLLGILLFDYTERKGLEPIAEELSGGQFLPPVQKLVATSISAPQGRNANRVPFGVPIVIVTPGFVRIAVIR